MQYSIKYRPTTFSEVIGQNVSVRICINSILMDRVPNAILFSGKHGTGKTTLARLYAKALNCDAFKSTGEVCNICPSCTDANKGSNSSILELDSASNNGVDDVRKLEELLRFQIFYRYKVIILDECHMLSKQAQSALLKALEEPAEKVIYLLVTTDKQKIEDPIKSRCLSMPLKNMSQADIETSLKNIMNAENYQYTEGFVKSLSIQGNGSLRDVQQLLEQVSLVAKDGILTEDLVNEYLGLVSSTQYKELATAHLARDMQYWFKVIDTWMYSGMDLVQIYETGLPNLLRDFMLCATGSYSEGIEYLSGLKHEDLFNHLQSTQTGVDRIRYFLYVWEDLLDVMKHTTYPRAAWAAYAARTTTNEFMERQGDMPQMW